MIEDHVGVIMWSHVFNDAHPVAPVVRTPDDCQFLCGGDHGEGERPRLVGIGHLLKRERSLREMLNLKNSREAERASVTRTWMRTRFVRG
jgi:hypothetical protein